MKRKIHLKRRIIKINKLRKRNILFIILIILILAIYLFFNFLTKNIGPTLLSYASLEVKKIASTIIGKALNSKISETIDINEIFIISKDKDGKIQTIDYNTKVVNLILIEAISTIQENIKYLNEGDIEKLEENGVLDEIYQKYDKEKVKQGIIYEVPLGVIFNNPFLNNLGPKIPVKFNLVGYLSSSLNTKVKTIGINSVILETIIDLKIQFVIELPISSKVEQETYKVPIAFKIIQGEIPNYYLNGYQQNSSILSLPVE